MNFSIFDVVFLFYVPLATKNFAPRFFSTSTFLFAIFFSVPLSLFLYLAFFAHFFQTQNGPLSFFLLFIFSRRLSLVAQEKRKPVVKRRCSRVRATKETKRKLLMITSCESTLVTFGNTEVEYVSNEKAAKDVKTAWNFLIMPLSAISFAITNRHFKLINTFQSVLQFFQNSGILDLYYV